MPAPAVAAVSVEASGGSYGGPPETQLGLPLHDPAQRPPTRARPPRPPTPTACIGPKTHTVQKTDWYCVPASIQMMLNLIKGTHSKGEAAQTMYWRYAQDHSTYPITDNGADAGGWAAAMKHWGGGNYYVGIHTTMQTSLRAAAKRMRATGKPVGMIVWGRHGGHAWVMTGFKSHCRPQSSPTTTPSPQCRPWVRCGRTARSAASHLIPVRASGSATPSSGTSSPRTSSTTHQPGTDAG